MQGDQNVSVHLMITIQLAGARRHFDHSLCMYVCMYVYVCICMYIKTYRL